MAQSVSIKNRTALEIGYASRDDGATSVDIVDEFFAIYRVSPCSGGFSERVSALFDRTSAFNIDGNCHFVAIVEIKFLGEFQRTVRVRCSEFANHVDLSGPVRVQGVVSSIWKCTERGTNGMCLGCC